MAKKFRMYVGSYLISFQVGVNVIGLPEFHYHTMIVSKGINEVDAKKYGML
jgi:hypothetical protein